MKALRAAHAWAQRLQDVDAPPVTSRYERNLIRLSCLAPDIQEAIFAGTQPSELTLQRLMTMDLPLRWDEQRALLRISHPTAQIAAPTIWLADGCANSLQRRC